jgi:hypothetical protein
MFTDSSAGSRLALLSIKRSNIDMKDFDFEVDSKKIKKNEQNKVNE